jgi:hypothetical protein
VNAFEFYIGYPNVFNPVLIPNPDNWIAFELELAFEADDPQAVLNAKKLIWKGAQAAIMNQYMVGGLTAATNGIYEGIPLQIYVCNTQQLVFDGIIDLSDPDTKFACDTVQCAISDYRIDRVKELMSTVSFGFLATSVANGGGGIINPTPISSGGDYVVIPYQRNDIPDYGNLLMTCLSMYQIYQMADDCIDALTKIATDATQIAADSGDASVPTEAPLSITDIVYLGIEMLFYLAVIVALLLVMIALIRAALNCLIAPVLTKFGMYAQTLMQRSCQYFGLQFQSTILINHPDYSRLVIMPTKTGWVSNKTFIQSLGILGNATQLMEYDDLYNLNHGGEAYGYYDGTCADFIASMETVFNAKAKIIDNNLGQPVLHFERWDYIYDVSTYKLPNISDQVPFNSVITPFNLLGGSKSAFATNAKDLAANYQVKYALDDSDVNTYNEYDGTSCFCTTSAITVSTGLQYNVTLRGFKDVEFEFAQATRKDFETATEKFFAAAYNILSAVADVGTLGLFSATFPLQVNSFNLTGHMVLSGNTTGIPKMFIAGANQTYTPISISSWGGRGSFTGVTIDPNNKNIISAAKLMKRFHFSNLALSANPGAPYTTAAAGTPYYNQYLVYKSQQVPFCCTDYLGVKTYNIITTFDNQQARVDSLRWNPYEGIANIDYRINKQFTKNLQTSFIVDGVTSYNNINSL